MREILFRGRRLDNKEWADGALITTTAVQQKTFIVDSACYTSGEVDEEGYTVFDWLNVYEVDPDTVGQYTGLSDKNGKWIFEGDIVKMHYFFENHDPYTLGAFEDETEVTGTVRIDPLGTYTETENATYDWGDYLQEPSEELEIIGNIYENPHLLGDANG